MRNQAIRTESDMVFALSKLRADTLELGFSDHDVTRVITAASELVRNILKYAGSGSIKYSILAEGEKLGVELIAHDNGPGIADVELALTDSYSSSGTLGMGLPGVRRLVDDFAFNTEVGVGTTVTFKVWKS